MSVEPVEPTPPAGEEGLQAIGKRLAEARQQQQLELGAAASRLHLSVEVLQALEQGRREALPAMTFVRGYIKSYARLLGLDEQQILTLLPQSESYRPAPLRPVGMGRARRPRPYGKWLFWLVVLATLAGVASYVVPRLEQLWSRSQSAPEDGALQLPLGDQASPQSPNVAFETEPDSPGEEPQEPAVVPEEEEPAPPSPPAPTVVDVAPPSAPAAATPASAVAEPVATTDISSPAMVTLRFREDSWVEMESHGRKLVVGIQTAGSQRSVRAEPPIHVLLGNAPGVELDYRGKSVDLKPHQRGKVARLTLED